MRNRFELEVDECKSADTHSRASLPAELGRVFHRDGLGVPARVRYGFVIVVKGGAA